jgi:hypothetical protein
MEIFIILYKKFRLSSSSQALIWKREQILKKLKLVLALLLKFLYTKDIVKI